MKKAVEWFLNSLADQLKAPEMADLYAAIFAGISGAVSSREAVNTIRSLRVTIVEGKKAVMKGAAAFVASGGMTAMGKMGHKDPEPPPAEVEKEVTGWVKGLGLRRFRSEIRRIGRELKGL